MDEYWHDVTFYISLQFFCYQQYLLVKKYAQENQIFLKGDIPILISTDSADVWQYPDFFDLSLAAESAPGYLQQKRSVLGISSLQMGCEEKNAV